MSISPIREAVRQLEALGLAEHVPHHGAKVMGLDVEELRELLVTLNTTQGGSFVVIEHNMDFIMKLCPHVICMVEGRILAEGSPRTVQSDRRVLEAYLGN